MAELKKPSSSSTERICRPAMFKNRIRRRSLYKLQKMKKNKERKEGKKLRSQERDRLGEKAPPKEVPRTIENTCVLDETTVLPDDKEISMDNANDEFSVYFDSRAVPKVLITSTDRPSMKSHFLMKELHKCIPNSSTLLRNGVDLKVLIPQANAKAFSDIVIVNEDRKTPNGLLIVHLPDGPSAHFKLTSFKRGYDIKGHGRSTSHQPEVILNHFSTRLGTTVGRMFASLFPYQPQFKGRQVVTFHNQRDYIFFRHHRYIFKNSKRVGMQELGPRFTLKLRSVQKGTFDSKYGEYYWIYKKDDTEKGKKKFHL